MNTVSTRSPRRSRSRAWTAERTNALFDRVNSHGNETIATVFSCSFGYLESRIGGNPQARLSEFFDQIERIVQRIEAAKARASAAASVPSAPSVFQSAAA